MAINLTYMKRLTKNQAAATRVRLELSSRGIMVPNDAEFYRVVKDDRIGMKVGSYTHSCHIDTSDFVVLLFADFHLGDAEAFEECFEVDRIY